jgi:glycerol-3-phosphate acyltransferase PlsY
LIEMVIAAFAGYLLGSIPFGLVITKFAGLGDIRDIGSGNIGATNVLRTGRRDLALMTLLMDSGKAAIALVLARQFLGEDAGFVAGAMAFIGHCFPIWLRFQGGKGIATYAGVILFGAWPVGFVCAALWLGFAYVFRFSSLAALVAAGLAPILAWFFKVPTVGIVAFLAMSIIVFFRHKENITRLLAGTEPKIGAKKTPDASAQEPSEPPLL